MRMQAPMKATTVLPQKPASPVAKKPKRQPPITAPTEAHGDVSEDAVTGALHHEPSGPSGQEAHEQPSHNATGMKTDFR